MIDIAIDENFNVIIDHRNDLATVEGEDEFTQYLRIALTEFLFEEIGSMNRENARSRIRLHAQRIVTQSDRLNQLVGIDIVDSETVPDGFDVYIEYDRGETDVFTLE